MGLSRRGLCRPSVMYGAPLDAVTGMPFGGWDRFLHGVLLPPKNTLYAFSPVLPGKRKFFQSVLGAQPSLDQVTGQRTETVPAQNEWWGDIYGGHGCPQLPLCPSSWCCLSPARFQGRGVIAVGSAKGIVGRGGWAVGTDERVRVQAGWEAGSTLLRASF